MQEGAQVRVFGREYTLEPLYGSNRTTFGRVLFFDSIGASGTCRGGLWYMCRRGLRILQNRKNLRKLYVSRIFLVPKARFLRIRSNFFDFERIIVF